MIQPFKFYIKEGIAIYVGRKIQTKLHCHHAIEIVIALDQAFLLSKDGVSFEKSMCSIITADLTHQFNGVDDYYLFIFLDAEYYLSLQLQAHLNLKYHGILHYNGAEIEKVRYQAKQWLYTKHEHEEAILEIILNFVQSIGQFEQENRNIEPRILNAVRIVRNSLHKEVALELVSAQVFLSESRFAHLFKEQIGIPFRRYVLWCRMQTALQAVVLGNSLTEAAYEGGFSDVAHLSRTFLKMFGVSPSEVLK